MRFGSITYPLSKKSTNIEGDLIGIHMRVFLPLFYVAEEERTSEKNFDIDPNYHTRLYVFVFIYTYRSHILQTCLTMLCFRCTSQIYRQEFCMWCRNILGLWCIKSHFFIISEIPCADRSMECASRQEWCFNSTPANQSWMLQHCHGTCGYCGMPDCERGFMLSEVGECIGKRIEEREGVS